MTGQPVKERIKSVSTCLLHCPNCPTAELPLLTSVARLASNVRNARNAAMEGHQHAEIVQRSMPRATTLNESREALERSEHQPREISLLSAW